MDDQELPPEASPEIGVYLSGKRRSATLVEFSAQFANVELNERAPLWFGMLVVVSIGNFPGFAGYVRAIEGTSMVIEFQPELHLSVVASVNERCFGSVG
ncbi:MAG: hypothetical protein WAT93_04320 [Pontixanthobacter sp.]